MTRPPGPPAAYRPRPEVRCRRIRRIVVVWSLGWTISCSATPPPIFDWGSFETTLAAMYRGEDANFDSATVVLRLTEEIERAQAEHRRIPPGKQALVGYLHQRRGALGLATRFFEAERTTYPESAVMIDRLLEGP